MTPIVGVIYWSHRIFIGAAYNPSAGDVWKRITCPPSDSRSNIPEVVIFHWSDLLGVAAEQAVELFLESFPALIVASDHLPQYFAEWP